MKIQRIISIGFALSLLAAPGMAQKGNTFAKDVAFLKKYQKVIVLKEKGSAAQVAVVPAYQGRVMTSAVGANGKSFGWINKELISQRKFVKHINAFGGEDRFWVGPEGGQFSVFFPKDAKFDLEHWQTPAAIDSEPYTVITKSPAAVTFQKRIHLTNYSGTKFNFEVRRTIRLVDRSRAKEALGFGVDKSVKMVGYESVNIVKNMGQAAWTKDTGLLSVWILGMMNASPSTTIVVPFKEGSEDELGKIVNDTYFGKVPESRLKIKDGVIYFCGDANYRSKIGVSPLRTKPIAGSYDSKNRVLTIVKFSFPGDTTDYVNSMWEIQENPFGGDVLNSYNDGPPKPGAKQLGKFYELESSSPALALEPGRGWTHTHKTFHFQGSEAALDKIAKTTLGVSLAQIKNGLK